MVLRILITAGHLVAKYLSVKNYIPFIILAYSFHTTYGQASGHQDTAANTDSAASVSTVSNARNNTSVKPRLGVKLSKDVHETSGLIRWNNQVWTHNDSGGEPALFAIEPTTGKVVQKVVITNATNVDWEDIAQDNKYIYIGDFGNNNGDRKDLKIYKVKKSDVKSKSAVKATVIHFSYSDQTNFAAARPANTNFDCEAMIAYGDSLFLFSKDWKDGNTRLYKLPKVAGTYTAEKTGQLNVHGLVTGATVIPDKRVIVLTGYNPLLKPFIYLLYNFTDNQFFAGSKQKVGIRENFLQVEGICPVTDTSFYISNEELNTVIKNPAKLQTINLSSLLNPYYTTLPSKTDPIAQHTGAHSYKPNSLPAAKKTVKH